MNQNLKYIFLLLCILLISCNTKSVVSKDLNKNNTTKTKLALENVAVSKIAFGSCSDEDKSQEHWLEIANDNPDLWIWGGDNIYADTEDMNVMAKKYAMQKSNKHYQNFISKVPVIGTWDDHDYGQNDGNKSYLKKKESKKLLLEFLDVSPLNPVYNHDGVYMSYEIGEPHKKVKIILLDSRSFQDILEEDKNSKARYLKSMDGDILGEEQWQWLTNELQNSSAEINIIVSSIQFIADKHAYEKWANFPKAKQRMLKLINENDKRNILFISGDRHIGEISKLSIDGLDYPLYDITSSGLTHSYTKSTEVNPYRIGDLVVDKNYGLLQFDWKPQSVNISCQIKGIDGKVLVNEDLGDFKINQ